MERCDLFEQANMLFAGHTIAECIKALTLLSAFTIGIATDNDEAADALVEAHASVIKEHIRLNREEIVEARARMGVARGSA